MIMNIEKTISEHAVSDILTPMLESQDRIVTEDVAPLFDQATGLDTPPASGTVTTTIEESRSVITAIIRKAWTATLTMLCGASVIGYITAAYTYLRNRLQGNETYGIPDRRSEISASSPLAANLALLNDRKIGGVPDAPDGMSLVHLLMVKYGIITELTDDNTGWIYNRDSYVSTLLSIFPNLKRLTLGCTKATVRLSSRGLNTLEYLCFANMEEFTYPLFYSGQSSQDYQHLTDVEFPSLIKGSPLAFITTSGWWAGEIVGPTRLYMPHLKEINRGTNTYSNSNAFFAVKFSSLEVLELPELERVNIPFYGGSCLSSLRELRMPNLVYCPTFTSTAHPSTSGLPNLILLEVGAIAHNFDLQYWNPTNVLADNDKKALFLSNFRSYIANRLTDNVSGNTLTLSQAVRNAIHAAESTYGIENIIITQKGWTITPAPN